MKNIFRLALILVFISSFTHISAQTYRLEAGYVQPVRYSDPMSNRYFNGARIGGTVDFNLPLDFMTIHTGLLYSYVYSDDTQKFSGSNSVRFRTQGHFIDIPVHVTALRTLFKDFKIFAFAGPNLNIGLYQPQKITNNISLDEILEFYNAYNVSLRNEDVYKGDLRRFNLQLEVGGGVQWRKYLVKGGYSFGINDLNKNSVLKQRQSGWYVSAAIEF